MGMRFVELGIARGAARGLDLISRCRKTRALILFPALLLPGGCFRDRMPILNPIGEVARAEADVFYMSVIVMAIIGIPVIAATLWMAWRYRSARGGDGYDPEFEDSAIIHQVTLFVPLFTIGVLGAITWVYTHRLDPYRPLAHDARPYEIQAISLDYKWLFIYPDEGIATINDLVAPTGRPVTLRLTSDPMMTAIFIPGLISQIYTMPGMETRANFLADRQAVLQGSNAMYSGPGFEYQRFKARLVSADQFRSWVASVKSGGGDALSKVPLLNQAAYKALLPPTTDTPVTYFASVSPDIFAEAVRKYMPKYQMKPLPTRAEFDGKVSSGEHKSH